MTRDTTPTDRRAYERPEIGDDWAEAWDDLVEDLDSASLYVDSTDNTSETDPIPGTTHFEDVDAESVNTDNLLNEDREPDIVVKQTDGEHVVIGSDEQLGSGDLDDAVSIAINNAAEGDRILFKSVEGTNTVEHVIEKELHLKFNESDVTIDHEGQFLLFRGVDNRDDPVDLAESIDKFGRVVELSDGSLWDVGDLIRLRSDDEYPSDDADAVAGELHKVRAIDGDTVTLAEPVRREYTTEQNAEALHVEPVTGSVTGLESQAVADDGDHIHVAFLYARDFAVRDCTLVGGERGVRCVDAYNGWVEGNTIERMRRPGIGYGVAPGPGCAHIVIRDNDISDCRHTIAISGGTSFRQAREIIVTDNRLHGNGMADNVDCHGQVWSWYVYDNTISSVGENAAITTAANVQVFRGNHIRTASTGLIDRDDESECTLVFEDNYIEGDGPIMELDDNEFESVVVRNNTAAEHSDVTEPVVDLSDIDKFVQSGNIGIENNAERTETLKTYFDSGQRENSFEVTAENIEKDENKTVIIEVLRYRDNEDGENNPLEMTVEGLGSDLTSVMEDEGLNASTNSGDAYTLIEPTATDTADRHHGQWVLDCDRGSVRGNGTPSTRGEGKALRKGFAELEFVADPFDLTVSAEAVGDGDDLEIQIAIWEMKSAEKASNLM